MDTSQISVYLGLGGFFWKMPFMSWNTNGVFLHMSHYRTSGGIDSTLAGITGYKSQAQALHYRWLNVTNLSLVTKRLYLLM